VPLALSPDGTWLVTGGFGALGLAVAGMLAERGARNMVLLGRNAPGPAAARKIADLELRGVRVVEALADVSDRDELKAVFDRIRNSLPPLRGVVHAAGVLDDALLLHQTPGKFAAVFAPKVQGAINLHELSVGENLDHFVLFSSFASLMGLPGESNYAAANAYLDSLAHHRRSLGLPALSIDWGPWAEAGMAARSGVHAVEPIPPAEGLRILAELMACSETQVTVMPGLRGSWRASHPRGADSPLLAGLAKPAGEAVAAGNFDRAAVLAADGTERERLVEAGIIGALSRTLSIPASKLAPGLPLSEHGLDSLSAFALINRIKSEMGVSLPIQKFLGGANIHQVAQDALQELLVSSLGTTPGVPEPVATEDDWETVEI
jgi:acyl carrier protein